MSNRAQRELDGQRRLAALVAQEMAAAVQNFQAANPPPAPPAPPATYYNIKNFTTCNPPKYSCNDGATALLQWFEEIESVFSISECPEPLQVKYDASLFTKRALAWWNKEKATCGMAAAHAMPWSELKTIMLAEFCPRNEIKKLETEFWELKQIVGNNAEYTTRFHELSLLVPRLVTPEPVAIEKYLDGLPPRIRDIVLGSKPTTLDDAVHLAASLTDNLVKDGDLVRTSKTRTKKGKDGKTGDETETKTIEGEPSKPKKRKTTNARKFAIPPQPINQAPLQPRQLPYNPAQKPYDGTWPTCATCNFHHPAGTTCRWCTRCNIYGHTLPFCRCS